MNKKSQIMEHYEDALFSVLMNEIAEEEGKILIEQNNCLKSSEENAVPEIISARCLDLIEKQYRKKANHRLFQKALKELKRIAIVCLIPICLFGVVFAASETIRVKTLNFLIDEFDFGSVFSFSSDLPQPPESHATLIDNLYVPDGYSLLSSQDGSLSTSRTYVNEKGYSICLTIVLYEGVTGNIIIDTEDANVVYETIDTTEVMIAHENNDHRAMWIDTEYAYVLTVEEQHEDVFFEILYSLF